METDSLISRRVPTHVERRTCVILALLYVGLALVVVPIAGLPAEENAGIAALSGLSVLFVAGCTALVLSLEYRRSGQASLLYLAAAYFYSALMAPLHVLAFPGVLIEGPVIGNEQTVQWLYACWRFGTAVLLVAGIAHARAAIDQPSARNRRLLTVCAWTVAACALLAAFFSTTQLPQTAEHQYGDFNTFLYSITIALCIAGVILIWRGGAFDDALYLWLAIALVAFAAELILTVAGGARYSLGWYAGRTSWMVSNCLLLVLWLTHESSADLPTAWRRASTYGSALCILFAGIVLHWLMLPWLGWSYSFATGFASVAVAVWLGGWVPATLIAVVGYFAISYWLMAPDTYETVWSVSRLLALALYCTTCGAIISLGQAMRRARDDYRLSEQRLRQSTHELQQADTNKSNFLAILSHELRNPMAPLRNALTLLSLNPERQTVAGMVPIMDRQLKHLTRLIDDLLDISRIDRGKLELKHERIAMDGVLKAAIETAKPNIEAKQHELVVRFPAEPIYVQGDAVRLTQVLSNLLNNAAKFTPTRGHIELGLRSEGSDAVVEVADNGIGIPAQELPRVFEMFMQLDSSRSVASGGLGLGLTLARSIMQIHGGKLEAFSEGTDKGSRFVMRLPAAATSVVTPLRAHARAAPERNRILVVDDNEDAANTLAEILRIEGHDVRVGYDGLEGLRQARAFSPHVAFVDLNMPGIDGFELARQLKADPRTCTTQLVALTGMGQEADIARTRAAGFSAHLSKPAAIEEVMRLAGMGEADASSGGGREAV